MDAARLTRTERSRPTARAPARSPAAAAAALAILILLGGAGSSRALSNDEVASRYRALHEAARDDSALALVGENLARAADVLSALIRAAIRSEGDASGSEPSARSWREAAAAFPGTARRAGADPIVDTVAVIAGGWGPAERTEKLRAESLYAAGYAAFVAGDNAAAKAAFSRALAAYRAIGDRYRAGYLEMNLGLVGRAEGDAAEARRRLLAAIDGFRATRDRRGEGWATGHLATVATERGDYPEAERLFSEALVISGAAGDPAREGELRNNLGNVRLARGRFREAGEGYAAAAALFAGAADPAKQAAALQNLGIVQEMLGDLGAARATLSACLELARTRGDAELESHAASNLGNVLFSLGETERAESLHVAALARDAAAGNAPLLVVDLENLARLLSARGAYTAADDTIASAIRLCEARGYDRESAYLLLARARLLRDVNELEESRRALERAAATAERIGDRSALGQAESRLGEIAALAGDDAGAAERFAAASSAFRESGEVLALLENENLRAVALLRGNDLAGAGAAADTAARIAASLGPVPEAARTDWVRARAEATAGRLDEARRLLDAARRRLPRHFLPDLAWRIELTRAEVEERAGRPEAAIAALLAGIDLVEDVRLGVLGQRERSRYVEDKEALYANAVSLLVAQARPEEAFEIAERARARAFLDQVSGDAGPAAPAAAPSGDAAAVRGRIASLLAGWAEVEAGGIEPSEMEAAGAISTALSDAYAESERAILPSLRAASPGGSRTEGADAIRRALPGGHVLLDYFYARDGLLLFAMTPVGLTAIPLDAPRAALADRIRALRSLLEDPASDRARLDGLLADLSRDLLGGAGRARFLPDGARLLIVPHAELNLVPFAALSAPARDVASDPPRRLVESCEVTMLPAASLLVAGGGREFRIGEGDTILVAGADAPRGRERLTFAREEARRVAGAYRGIAPVSLLADGEATETAWKAGAPSAGRIHVAAHARRSGGSPLFSAIELEPSREDDGLLEVHEILRLRLTADLAVLSGCETARDAGFAAEMPPGDELVGLARAFLSAGARSVVATLWPVADRASADFMAEFHASLAGLDPPGALARVQRRWAAQTGPRSHPFYWAAPVLLAGRTARH